MKLHELKEALKKKGTYAGVRFCDNTKDAIQTYMDENNIPNMLDKEKLHSTLLYSRKHCPNYTPAGDTSMTGYPDEFVVWNTQAPAGKEGETSRCLVLKYHCPELEKRHADLRAEHGATHDYPDYTPHITLSYDIGDTDVEQLPDISKFLSQINIVHEYGEDLDLDWASANKN